MITMLVEQMLKEKDIEMVIMKAAEVFLDVIEKEEAKGNAKGKQQKLS